MATDYGAALRGLAARIPLYKGTRWGTCLLAALAMLLACGWVKSWVRPDPLVQSMIVRQPAPIRPPEIREVTKWRERVVTREVKILEPPTAKAQKQLEERFSLDLGRDDLIATAQLPAAPYGGQAVVTAPKDGGAAEVTFLAEPAPFFELGGARQVGLRWDALRDVGGVYYRQDVFRLGRVTVDAEVSASAGQDQPAAVGAAIGAYVRF